MQHQVCGIDMKKRVHKLRIVEVFKLNTPEFASLDFETNP